MTNFSSAFLWFFCLFAFFCPATTSADIYKYTDSHGVISMTNRLDAVPARYRAKMTVIKDASASKDDPAPKAAQPQAPTVDDSALDQPKTAQSESAPVRKFQELSGAYPWFRPLCYVAAVLAAFLMVNKISSLLPSPLLGRVIHLAFIVGLVVFLFKSYSDHVAETSHKLKEEAASIVKKSQARQESLSPELDSPSRAPEGASVR
jgi:hypothetical protein